MIGKELFGFAQHRDKARFMRALAIVFGAYPVTGIAVAKGRAALIGPTLASEAIDEALNDETFQGYVVAGLFGLGVSGGLGIAADIGATAWTRNRFALATMFEPPVLSTVLNGLEIAGSVVVGAATGDVEEFERAVLAFGRETGGLGVGITKRLAGDTRGGSGGFGTRPAGGFGGGAL